MPLSAEDKLLLERIDNDFTYHPPDEEQTQKYTRLRDNAKQLARDIVALCPDSRDRSLALTKLEEAVFWANAAIARGGSSG